jgi:hypothetical protein
LPYLYLSTVRKVSIQVLADETGMCGFAIMNEEQFLTNDKWYVGQEIRYAIFQDTFVIPPKKPVWKYMSCSEYKKTLCRSYKIQFIVQRF